MHNRLLKLQAFMAEQNLSAVIINKPENRRYFSGFTGTAGSLLLTQDRSFLLTDFRYIEQALKQTSGFEVIKFSHNCYETMVNLLRKQGLVRIGFESDFVTYQSYRNMTKYIPAESLVPVTLDKLRLVKDFSELKLIQQAVKIADDAFTHILSVLKPGITERDVALELEYKMRKLGAEKPAFDTIVASGVRGALPHGVASDKKIENGDFVTLDFGAVYHGYHSDITRTVCIGKASSKQREIYNIVLEAQLVGLKLISAGRTCKDVDAASRDVIRKYNYGEYFGHGLGHGVGLVIHEEPRLSPTNTEGILEECTVVTVEPGIYIPEWGGVRIEDMVVVTAQNVEILTKSSKQLIELDF